MVEVPDEAPAVTVLVDGSLIKVATPEPVRAFITNHDAGVYLDLVGAPR